MNFLKSIQREIYIVILTCALFYFILFMYNVPIQAYMIGLGIVLFVSMIYWGIHYMNFKKE